MTSLFKLFACSICAALLSGCAPPLNTFYKEGADVDRLNRDAARCKTEAIKAVPVDKDIRIIPGSKVPRTFCDASGYCETVWVQTFPDRIQTYDANAGLRRDFVTQCMVAKGYQPVRLPQCDQSMVNQTPLAATRTLPRLTPESCAIRLSTGQWQIVTP